MKITSVWISALPKLLYFSPLGFNSALFVSVFCHILIFQPFKKIFHDCEDWRLWAIKNTMWNLWKWLDNPLNSLWNWITLQEPSIHSLFHCLLNIYMQNYETWIFYFSLKVSPQNNKIILSSKASVYIKSCL